MAVILGIVTLLSAASGQAAGQPAESGIELGQDIRLREAVELTLRNNPELAAAQKELLALDGLSLQAGLVRNPDIIAGGDEIGGVGRTTTIRISQLVELGGKRAYRVAAVSAARERAERESAVLRGDILTRLAQAFVDVLAAQERTVQAGDNLGLAQRVTDAVGKRVQAGKVSPVESTRTRVGLTTARIDLEQAERDLTAARKRLASFWSEEAPRFGRAVGRLDELVSLPPMDELSARLPNNPLLQQRDKSIGEREALLELERARRIPDIVVSAGIQRIQQTQDNTWVAGVAIPLPLFDRNQGNLEAAYQRLARARDDKHAIELSLASDLVQTFETVRAAETEIRLLRDDVLPAAQSVFEATNIGYEFGKFGFLDVLDAQRTLFLNRTLYLRALARYQRLVAELERIVGGPVDVARATQPRNP